MRRLEICNITKQYKKKKILDNISCTFTEGINTLLGPNGAGKSTLMSIISTAASPTFGEVKLDGEEIISLGEKYREQMAMLFQHQPYFPSAKVNEFMRYNAELKGIPSKTIPELIEKALQRLGVGECGNMKMKELSGGMRQRIFIAQTIISDPAVIILDEPSAGLDIAERLELKGIIKELGRSALVIISTHIVSDIEDITDRLFIIEKGKLLWSGDTNDVPNSDISGFYLKMTKGEKTCYGAY